MKSELIMGEAPVEGISMDVSVSEAKKILSCLQIQAKRNEETRKRERRLMYRAHMFPFAYPHHLYEKTKIEKMADELEALIKDAEQG